MLIPCNGGASRGTLGTSQKIGQVFERMSKGSNYVPQATEREIYCGIRDFNKKASDLGDFLKYDSQVKSN